MEPTTNEEWAALCRVQIDTIERLAVINEGQADRVMHLTHERDTALRAVAAPQQHAQSLDLSRVTCWVQEGDGTLCQSVEAVGDIKDPDNAFVRLSAVLRLTGGVQQHAQAALSDCSYQQLFNAIAAATKAGGPVSISVDAFRKELSIQQPVAAPTWKCATCAATSANSCIANGCAACEQGEPSIQQEGAALDDELPPLPTKHYEFTSPKTGWFTAKQMREYARAAIAAPAPAQQVPTA